MGFKKPYYIGLFLMAILITSLPKLWCKQKYSWNDSILTIKPGRVCLNPSTAPKPQRITCNQVINTTRNVSTALESWSLTWYDHYGKALVTSRTRLDQANKVVFNSVMVQSPGMFTCISKNRDSLLKPENRSVMVEITPGPIQEIVSEPVFTEEEDGSDVIKIAWKSHSRTRGKYHYSYRVVYKLPTDEYYPETHEWQTAVQPVCVGLMCKGSFFTDGYTAGNISFYIVTSIGGCDVSSQIWSFFVTYWLWHECTVSPAGTVLFTPPTPTHLLITTTHRKVALSWVGDEPYKAYYLYNCSKSSITKPKGVKIYHQLTPTIQLSDEDIRPYKPYDQCTFCLFIQLYKCGGYSLPRCNTTRLSEERPSEAPTITCSSDTCPTTYERHTRNVTITWKLPAKETWNGVLTKIIVTIHSENVVVKVFELPLSNPSLNSSSTLVLTLNKTQGYAISMQACTKEGCSQGGNNLQILRLSNEVDSSTTTDVLLVGAVISSVVLLVLVAVMLLVVIRRRKASSPRPASGALTLPEIREPPDHEYSAQDDTEVFDVLHKDYII